MPDGDSEQHAKYLVPAGWHRVEESIKRSRFITTMQRAETAQQAKDFIAQIRGEFPDANHHCWAYVAGSPGSSHTIGMSDDGEPHGSAGKPMLNVLLHGRVGEIVAVCTRYFGGVKLGTGGLSRAYAGGVTRALAELPTKIHQELAWVEITTPYEYAGAIERLVCQLRIEMEDISYGAQVHIRLSVPVAVISQFSDGVRELTRGSVLPVVQLQRR